MKIVNEKATQKINVKPSDNLRVDEVRAILQAERKKILSKTETLSILLDFWLTKNKSK